MGGDFVNFGVNVKRKNKFDGDTKLKRSDKNQKPMSDSELRFTDLQRRRSDPRFADDDELTSGKKIQAKKNKKGNTGKGTKENTAEYNVNVEKKKKKKKNVKTGEMGSMRFNLKSIKPDSRPRGEPAMLGRKLLQTVTISKGSIHP